MHIEMKFPFCLVVFPSAEGVMVFRQQSNYAFSTCDGVISTIKVSHFSPK